MLAKLRLLPVVDVQSAAQAALDIQTYLNQLPSLGPVINVMDAGVMGDGVTDDSRAIQSVRDELFSKKGGTLFFPPGSYLCNAASLTNLASSSKAVNWVGSGIRASTIFTTASLSAPLFTYGGGPANARDASGTSTYISNYGGIANLGFNDGSAAKLNTLVELIETQHFWMENVLIQNAVFGTGLSMLGSITSGGIGAASPPIAWRGKFDNVIVTVCEKPLYMENCDENEFYSGSFAVATHTQRGKLVAETANSLNAVRIRQGYNNRFFGTLCSGDDSFTPTDFRSAYVAFKFDAVVQGANQGHLLKGCVYEGFGDRPVWVEASSNTAIVVEEPNASICAGLYLNVGAGAQPANGFEFKAPVHYKWEINQAGPAAQPLDTTNNTGAPATVSPAASKTNYTSVISNGHATSIATFTGIAPGQPFMVRLDANCTIIDSSQAGGIDIECWGRQNIVGSAVMLIPFIQGYGASFQCGPPVSITDGVLQTGNAYVATPQVPTGYIIVKDVTGTPYKVSVTA